MEEETSGEILGDSTGNIYENLRQTRPSSWVNETRSFYQDPPELSSLIADSGEQRTLWSPWCIEEPMKKTSQHSGKQICFRERRNFSPPRLAKRRPIFKFLPLSTLVFLFFLFFSFLFISRIVGKFYVATRYSLDVED